MIQMHPARVLTMAWGSLLHVLRHDVQAYYYGSTPSTIDCVGGKQGRVGVCDMHACVRAHLRVCVRMCVCVRVRACAVTTTPQPERWQTIYVARAKSPRRQHRTGLLELDAFLHRNVRSNPRTSANNGRYPTIRHGTMIATIREPSIHVLAGSRFVR